MTRISASAAYRIAFTYAAAFAAVILILGVAVYFAADAEFRTLRDAEISEELTDLSHESDLLPEIAQREGRRASSGFVYALFDPAGRRISGKMDTPRPDVGFSMIVFQDPDEGPDEARAKAVDLSDGRRLVVAVDSETVETIDRTILTLFGLAFLVVLAAGGVGALLLGRYLQRRLATISGTARAIMAGELNQRVSVGPRRDEFDEVALALNAMLDRIAGLMENIRQVSSDVAHDLRTPLLRLRSQLELVGKVDGAAERALELGDELLKLFGSILRITEVEGGGLERGFTLIDLSTLADDVADSFLPAVKDSGRELDWRVEPGISVRGDRELLAQAIANLLDNARVHTPTGTRITLSVGSMGGEAYVIVADNGPGVSPDERAAILRRFYRTEASRTTPGNGLGLSLAAAVATSHGGRMLVEGNAPGLRVLLFLPRI